jgi:hypothetical protein
MKTLAHLTVWLLAIALAACGLMVGIAGTVFLPLVDACLSLLLTAAGCVLGAVAFDRVTGIAPEVYVDVATDYFRVRNWWRRRRLKFLVDCASALRFDPYR